MQGGGSGVAGSVSTASVEIASAFTRPSARASLRRQRVGHETVKADPGSDSQHLPPGSKVTMALLPQTAGRRLY